MYNKILKELQERSSEGMFEINLNEFMINNSIEPHELNSYLNELQNERLITFTYEITTSDLKPTSIFKGAFGEVKKVSYGEEFVHNFYCNLTYKGSKETIQ